MAIPNRTVAITGVFAEDATTPVPLTPVAGVSYRDTSMTETDVKEGWAYKTVVDSGKFNQALYEYASITKQLEKYGFLPWSSLTDYVQGSLCLGSNGTIYQAKQATGPSSTAYDPVNDTSHTYWEDFVGDTYVTKATAQTITGNKTFTGNVSVPTPSATDNDTSAATSAMVQTAFANAIGTPRDVTILWGDGTGVDAPSQFQLSEDFTNFEMLGYFVGNDSGYVRSVSLVSTYWLDWCMKNTPSNSSVCLGDSGLIYTAINSYNHNSYPSTKTLFYVNGQNSVSYYIFGINRKVTTVPDPLS